MARTAIKELYTGYIDCEPRSIDWSDALGEDCDGWQSYECHECSGCGKDVVVNHSGDCPNCETPTYTDGPVMNYWYPIRIDDCAEAARTIKHLPLCVVEFKDGQTGFALTGGGMDLSWEICEAFMRLGYLPPVYFELPMMCGRGTSARDRWIIAGCRQAIRVATKRMASRAQRLDRMVKWAREREAEQITA